MDFIFAVNPLTKVKNLLQMYKSKEVNKSVREIQEKIKTKLYERGKRKRLTDRTGISAYNLNKAVNDKYPDLELLEKIEKAIS